MEAIISSARLAGTDVIYLSIYLSLSLLPSPLFPLPVYFSGIVTVTITVTVTVTVTVIVSVFVLFLFLLLSLSLIISLSTMCV